MTKRQIKTKMRITSGRNEKIVPGDLSPAADLRDDQRHKSVGCHRGSSTDRPFHSSEGNDSNFQLSSLSNQAWAEPKPIDLSMSLVRRTKKTFEF